LFSWDKLVGMMERGRGVRRKKQKSVTGTFVAFVQ